MAKVSKSGPQKATPEVAKANKANKVNKDAAATPAATPAMTEKDKSAASTVGGKGKQSAKNTRTRVGGTAVQGARSTQPREITTTNPQQQQAESYNRDMRRRMEHLGTAPGQSTNTMQNQRQKRLERRKKRIEERREKIRKVAATGPSKITLGRKNTLFLIGVSVLIVAIVIIAVLVNHFK
jgi:hypothetical protein